MEYNFDRKSFPPKMGILEVIQDRVRWNKFEPSKPEKRHKPYLIDQVCGYHFNQKGHSYEDMNPVIIEEVIPKNDNYLRMKRERYWINEYEAKDFGANRRF